MEIRDSQHWPKVIKYIAGYSIYDITSGNFEKEKKRKEYICNMNEINITILILKQI